MEALFPAISTTSCRKQLPKRLPLPKMQIRHIMIKQLINTSCRARQQNRKPFFQKSLLHHVRNHCQSGIHSKNNRQIRHVMIKQLIHTSRRARSRRFHMTMRTSSVSSPFSAASSILCIYESEQAIYKHQITAKKIS